MRLETERLILRRYEPGDAEELVALHNDPEVRRFINMPEFGRGQAELRIARDREEWEALGHRHLAVIDRASGRFLGRVAVHDWQQFGETEVGWILTAGARGQGYATEAAGACVAWAFANLPVAYLISLIRPDNAASIAVARRLGMSRLREDEVSGVRVSVYALPRPS